MAREPKTRANYVIRTTPGAKPRPLMDPWDKTMEEGGWLCSGCRYELNHDDYLVEKAGHIVKVVGYECPVCGLMRLKEGGVWTTRDSRMNIRARHFDWASMAIPHCPRMNMTRNG